MKFKNENKFGAFLDKILSWIYVTIFGIIFLGWLHTRCLSYPHLKKGSGRGINCAYAFAYDIPEWLRTGLKFYFYIGIGILAGGCILHFLNKEIISDNTVGDLFILYLLINLLLIIIIEYSNNWLIFN